jgi:uncharacterized protein YqgC (DUF456 family)
MDWQQWTGLAVTWFVMLIGTLGCVLPAVPGAPLVFLAAVAHRLYFGAEQSVGNLGLGIIIGLMVFSLVLDYLATMYGAKKLGATRNGIIGSVVGGIAGLLLFNIPGALIGPFVGALSFEMLGGKDWKTSGKAGLGATLGLLGGAVGKVACSLAMAAVFSVNVLYRLFY